MSSKMFCSGVKVKTTQPEQKTHMLLHLSPRIFLRLVRQFQPYAARSACVTSFSHGYLCAVAVEISVEIVDNVHLTSSFGFEIEELKIVSVACGERRRRCCV